MSLFPNYDVWHFPIYKSDHALILLNTERVQLDKYNDKIFRFESFWLSNENCKNIVADSWNVFLSTPIETRLEHCANSL